MRALSFIVIFFLAVLQCCYGQLTKPHGAFYILPDSLVTDYTQKIEPLYEMVIDGKYDEVNELIVEYHEVLNRKRTPLEKTYEKALKGYLKSEEEKHDTAMIVFIRTVERHHFGDDPLSFILQFYYTRALFKANLYPTSANELHRLIAQTERIHDVPAVNRIRLYYEFGDHYRLAYKPDSAIYFYNSGVKMIEAQELNEPYLKAIGLAKQGETYAENDRKNKSIRKFNKALGQLTLNPKTDSLYLAEIYRSIGRSYSLKGRTDSSIMYYETSAGILKSLGNNHLLALTILDMALQYIKKQQQEEVSRLIKNVNEIYPATQLPYEVNKKLAYTLFEKHKAREDFYLALKWKERYDTIIAQEILEKNIQQANARQAGVWAHLDRMSDNFELNYAMEQQVSAALHRQNRFKIMLIITITLFSILSIYSIVRMYRTRNHILQQQNQLQTAENEVVRLKLNNEQLEKEKLALTVNQKQKEITDLALDISARHHLSTEILEKIQDIHPERPEMVRKELSELSLMLNQNLYNDEKRNLLIENIGKVNREFFDSLYAKHPDLVPSERELCGLIRLNMSGKDISGILNISDFAVKKRRYRLRKKLGLAPDDDIALYLQGF